MLKILKRHWAVVAFLTLVPVCVAVLIAATGPKDYDATATLFAPVGTAGAQTVGRDDLEYADRLMNTYERIGESESLRQAVLKKLGSDIPLKIAVQPDPNTELLRVTARSDGPSKAVDAANAAAEELQKRVNDLRQGQADIDDLRKELAEVEREIAAKRRELRGASPTRIEEVNGEINVLQIRYQSLNQETSAKLARSGEGKLSISDPATSATGGAFQDKRRTLAIILLLGLIAGIGAAFVLERRWPQLDSLEEIEEAAGAPVLVTVPLLRRRKRRSAYGGRNQPSPVFESTTQQSEAINSLRARLLAHETRTAPLKTLVVTSAADGDGKSTIASNLAASLARTDRSVVIVDADFRQPALDRIFSVNNKGGFAEALEENGSAPPLQPLNTSIKHLSVLPSGTPHDASTSLLSTPRTADVLDELERRFDYVIVDSPSLQSTSDSALLARQADAVVVVVREVPVLDGIVHGTRADLDAVGARTLGLVINRWRGARFGGEAP